MDELLRIEHLTVGFRAGGRTVEVVNDLSLGFTLGEVHGIVGESGCGKTVTCLASLGLLPPNGFIREGAVYFAGRDLTKLRQPELESLRGSEMTYIPQDPQSALNPVLTIGMQLAEPLVLHQGYSWNEARREAERQLDHVGIPLSHQRMNEYPHQLSGGMCQRVLIAMAVICRPKLLVADEPTTALDVTVQRQILDLLNDMKREREMTIVVITHDLGVIAEMCDRVSVMYAGRLVETGKIDQLFFASQHPYTRGLLSSLPSLNESRARLLAIDGSVPSPQEEPVPGCRFAPRCPRATSECHDVVPELRQNGADSTLVACHHPHVDAVGVLR